MDERIADGVPEEAAAVAAASGAFPRVSPSLETQKSTLGFQVHFVSGAEGCVM